MIDAKAPYVKQFFRQWRALDTKKYAGATGRARLLCFRRWIRCEKAGFTRDPLVVLKDDQGIQNRRRYNALHSEGSKAVAAS